MSLKNKLINDKTIELISIEDDIEIQYDPDKTIGYDFTVEDYFTFMTDDGVYVQDTMSIVHPLSNKSQREVKEKMMRGEGFANSSSVIFSLSKEMGVGLFLLTKDIKGKNSPVVVTDKDLETATDPYVNVIFRGIETTMGKAIFNSCFPVDFPFYNEQVTKGKANGLISPLMEKYGFEVARDSYFKMEKIAFKFATIMAPSINIDDLELPPSILKIKEKVKGSTPEQAAILLDEAMVLLKEHLKNTSMYDLSESGSTKGWNQPFQILVSKGVIADSSGNLLDPIAASFSDGFSNKDYFSASQGARKGICDRVLNTADSGYFSRQLAYVLNSVEANKELSDCGTKRGLPIRIKKDMYRKLKGRYIITDEKSGKTELFNPDDHKEGDVVFFRSPIYCESSKICHKCYGKLLQRIKTPYIGIVAGQVMGEVVTQSTMKTFHTGGAVEIIKRNVLEDIIQNDPYIENKKVLDNYIKQDGNVLYTNKKCKLIINLKDDYDSGQFEYDDQEKKLYLKGMISKIEYENKIFNIVLDYSVNVLVNDNANTMLTKNIIQIEYKPNETILEVLTEANIITEQLQYVKRLLGGKEIYKDANHMFMKIYSIYGTISGMDLVHLEVLLSQCFRDKDNNQLPARLGKKWNPTMINIKKIVFSSGFLQGLSFENIGTALLTGLINEEQPEKSILEKVLTGELYEPTRDELKRMEKQKDRAR